MDKQDHTDEGYIKFARATYKKSNTWQALNPIQKVIMITLVMMANHSDGKWWDDYKKEWVEVKRGQLITSLENLRRACGKGISIQNIRTCFVNLEKMGFLTNKSTKHYRLVTLVNYDLYQSHDNYLTKQSTNAQQSPNKALTINKNDKNGKNVNKAIGENAVLDHLIELYKQYHPQAVKRFKVGGVVKARSVFEEAINNGADRERLAQAIVDNPEIPPWDIVKAIEETPPTYDENKEYMDAFIKRCQEDGWYSDD